MQLQYQIRLDCHSIYLGPTTSYAFIDMVDHGHFSSLRRNTVGFQPDLYGTWNSRQRGTIFLGAQQEQSFQAWSASSWCFRCQLASLLLYPKHYLPTSKWSPGHCYSIIESTRWSLYVCCSNISDQTLEAKHVVFCQTSKKQIHWWFPDTVCISNNHVLKHETWANLVKILSKQVCKLLRECRPIKRNLHQFWFKINKKGD